MIINSFMLTIQLIKIFRLLQVTQLILSQGKIQIPPELSGEQNLKAIYRVSRQLSNLNKNIIQNQKKQRQLQDKLVVQNVHKNQRIYTLTLVQLFVIILCGAYQIFALRRFLIEKNLY